MRLRAKEPATQLPESEHAAEPPSAGGGGVAASYFEQLSKLLLHNLAVQVAGLEIEYEDERQAEHRYSARLRLAAMHVHAADEEWRTAFVPHASEVRRRAELRGLSLSFSRAEEDQRQTEWKEAQPKEAQPKTPQPACTPRTWR